MFGKRKLEKIQQAENAESLKNLLAYTKGIMEEYKDHQIHNIEKHPVYKTVIMPLAEHIQSIITTNLMKYSYEKLNDKEYIINYRNTLNSLGELSVACDNIAKENITASVVSVEKGNRNIYTIKDTALICPIWNKDRYIDNLNTIGADVNNPFKQNSNHLITEILPIKVLITANGNHSTYAAKRKREGILEAAQRIDLSKSFPLITFDGTYLHIKTEPENYLYTPNPYKPICFEAGALYEVARLIKEYGY